MSEANPTATYLLVKDFPSYRVGDDGSVWMWSKRHGWKRMKYRPSKAGYLRVVLNPGYHRKSVHRLVLETFVGPCPEGMECLHGPDHNPANCSLINLRWGTRAQNNAERRSPCGVQQHLSKLNDNIVREIRANPDKLSRREQATKYGVHLSTLKSVVRRETWKHVV